MKKPSSLRATKGFTLDGNLQAFYRHCSALFCKCLKIAIWRETNLVAATGVRRSVKRVGDDQHSEGNVSIHPFATCECGVSLGGERSWLVAAYA